MSAIDDIIKFIAQHILGMAIVGVVVAIMLVLAFLSEPGQALMKFLGANPVFILFGALNFMGYVALYIWMLRPKDPEAERLGPLEVFERMIVQDWAAQYEIMRFEFIAPATDPTHGVFFSGEIFRGYKPCTIKVSDKKQTAGRMMRVYKKELTDDEITKEFKKGQTFEEKIISAKQTEMQLNAMAKRTAESTELYGVPKT